MRLKTILLPSIILALSCAAIAGDCVADVPVHLNWCSRDHGFNEGASCGLNALSGLGLGGLPVQPLLGNAFDRTNMMGATKAAWKGGFKKQAVDAAICCQIHNGDAHACLSSHRNLVEQWLSSQP